MKEPYLFKLDKNSVGSRHRFFKMVRLYYLYWHIAENECCRSKTRIRFTAASNSMHDLIKNIYERIIRYA